MAIGQFVTAGGFEFLIESLQQVVFHFQFSPALAADEVMVRVLSDLIDEMSIALVGSMSKPVPGEEVEGAVNGGFR